MWKTKLFPTPQAFKSWVKSDGKKYQWVEIAVNNAWGIQYRPLRKI